MAIGYFVVGDLPSLPFSVFFGIATVLNVLALFAFTWVIRTRRGPSSTQGVKLGLAVGVAGGTPSLDIWISLGLFVQALRGHLPF